MPRSFARARTFAPTPGGSLAEIEASLSTLLRAAERHGPHAPAAAGFRSAIRRRGQEAFAAGGIEAADYLLARIRDADPAKADAREAILSAAWAGLPGWRE